VYFYTQCIMHVHINGVPKIPAGCNNAGDGGKIIHPHGVLSVEKRPVQGGLIKFAIIYNTLYGDRRLLK